MCPIAGSDAPAMSCEAFTTFSNGFCSALPVPVQWGGPFSVTSGKTGAGGLSWAGWGSLRNLRNWKLNVCAVDVDELPRLQPSLWSQWWALWSSWQISVLFCDGPVTCSGHLTKWLLDSSTPWHWLGIHHGYQKRNGVLKDVGMKSEISRSG